MEMAIKRRACYNRNRKTQGRYAVPVVAHTPKMEMAIKRRACYNRNRKTQGRYAVPVVEHWLDGRSAGDV